MWRGAFDSGDAASDGHNGELNLQFVFHFDQPPGDRDGMNAEVGLLDLAAAGVSFRLFVDGGADLVSLPVKTQATYDQPSALAGFGDGGGTETDVWEAVALQDIGLHGALNFRLLRRAQIFVVLDRQFAGLDAEPDVRRIGFLQTSLHDRCGDPVLMTGSGEQSGSAYMDAERAACGVNWPFGCRGKAGSRDRQTERGRCYYACIFHLRQRRASVSCRPRSKRGRLTRIQGSRTLPAPGRRW